eukprot:TRINITY_DN1656_c0_g1_i3.p4 TRINITY_DN1656_c0_g1~~TRINITY_DN1656_c0_g1_i3.p4  ORF type:complete len:101 (-),score=8.36 TRINITY_DN1656_c0_g1_i3:730-1032(-)
MLAEMIRLFGINDVILLAKLFQHGVHSVPETRFTRTAQKLRIGLFVVSSAAAVEHHSSDISKSANTWQFRRMLYAALNLKALRVWRTARTTIARLIRYVL